MVGTILDEMTEIRWIPPMTTQPTMEAMMTPMMKRNPNVFSIPIGVVNTVVTDSTN